MLNFVQYSEQITSNSDKEFLESLALLASGTQAENEKPLTPTSDDKSETTDILLNSLKQTSTLDAVMLKPHDLEPNVTLTPGQLLGQRCVCLKATSVIGENDLIVLDRKFRWQESELPATLDRADLHKYLKGAGDIQPNAEIDTQPTAQFPYQFNHLKVRYTAFSGVAREVQTKLFSQLEIKPDDAAEKVFTGYAFDGEKFVYSETYAADEEKGRR